MNCFGILISKLRKIITTGNSNETENSNNKLARQTNIFQLIENLLSQCDDSCTMMTKEFWSDFFINFKDHHMNKDELN